MPIRTITADRGDDGLRLDLAVRRHLADVPHATRTKVQRWIEDGQVQINGLVVSRVASRAAAGDTITIVLPDFPERHAPAAERMRLDILFEDAHCLAVNKPPGIVAHPTHRNAAGTLINGLLWYARDWPAGMRPSLVSRLDKETSGVILVARTPAMHTALQRSLGAPDAEKHYLAIVHGRTAGSGTIDLRLRRDPLDRRRVIASPTIGAISRTEFQRVARTRVGATWLSVVRCRLVTGRTHQLRVHLAARDWPIVGDSVYGRGHDHRNGDVAMRQVMKDFPRQALHASSVTFTHPVTGERVRIEAPLPRDMRELMRKAGI